MRAFFRCLAILLAFTWSASADESLDRGRDMFLFGEGISAEISGNSVGGAAFACKACHGTGAAGKREGATEFPAIDWQTLSSKTYDEASFAKALSTGIAADGRRLGAIMPRYSLSETDVSALTAYLKEVRNEQRSGVTPDEVVFAVASSDEFAGTARELTKNLNERFAALNTRGGIYHRKLKAVSTVEDAVLANSIAVVGLISGNNKLSDGLIKRGIPSLFAFSPTDGDEDPDFVRGSGASLRDAIDALMNNAVDQGYASLTVCSVGDAEFLNLVRQSALRMQISLTEQGVADCVSGSEDPLMLLSENARVWMNEPGFAGRKIYGLLDQLAPVADAFRQKGNTLFLANVRPALMRRAAEQGINLPAAHAELVSLLLEDILTRAGRDLTRAALVQAIDDLRFSKEAFPELDYTRNRATGGSEVEIIEVAPR